MVSGVCWPWRCTPTFLLVFLGTWGCLSFLLILSSNEISDKSRREIQLFSKDDNGQHKEKAIIKNAQDKRVDNQDGGRRRHDVIHVCFTSDQNTVIGAMAAINSVSKNTKHRVKYHIIVESALVSHVKQWLVRSELWSLDTEVIGFNVSLLHGKIKVRGGRTALAKPMNYARFFYPILLPGVRGRLVHLDDDVIVQGDIAQLLHVKFKSGQIAAFAEDCVPESKRFSKIENKYVNFINFKNKHVKALYMEPEACAFNTGVFVTDLGAWSTLNISQRLLYWTELNTRENIYGNEKGGGGSQPPMMLVFYKQYAAMDPLWHLRHLGAPRAGQHYSAEVIRKAKLLHWNGPQKPWGDFAQFQRVWDRYYIPDPKRKYLPVRQKHKDKIKRDLPT